MDSIFRLKTMATSALAISAVVLSLSATADAPRKPNIVVYEGFGIGQTFASAGFGSPVWNALPTIPGFDNGAKQIGFDSGVCTTTYLAGGNRRGLGDPTNNRVAEFDQKTSGALSECTWTTHLNADRTAKTSQGSITVSGTYPDVTVAGNEKSQYAIIGGTGAYAGVRGYLEVAMTGACTGSFTDPTACVLKESFFLL